MNASCASGIFLGACLSECLLTPLASPGSRPPRPQRGARVGEGAGGLCVFRALAARVHRSVWKLAAAARDVFSRQVRVPRLGRELSTVVTTRSRGPPGLVVLQCSTADPIRSDPIRPVVFLREGKIRRRWNTYSVRTSDQARGPAEFKHITKRRKRN